MSHILEPFAAFEVLSELVRLYDLTDFVRWPHVSSFRSLAELMDQLAEADYDRTSGLIRVSEVLRSPKGPVFTCAP